MEVGTGPLDPDRIGRVLLCNGYGAPTVAEGMGRPVPVPVPLCAVTEAERARMPARAVMTMSGAIAMDLASVAGRVGTGRCQKWVGGDDMCDICKRR